MTEGRARTPGQSHAKVGKYLLFETLGHGAFGKVKRAVHEDTGKTFAVKVMQKSQIRDQEMTLQVRREITVMKALRHKNIVNLYEVLMSAKHIYMVMDLVAGGELYDELMRRKEPFDETEARNYFRQLAEGMLYCHARSVFHRDLKFENLLLDNDGVIKIADFGLVSIKGAGSSTELLHTQVGTPHYTAPEIITRASDGYDGVKVDVWSSAIILYGLVAGSLPFMDEDIQVLYNNIVNQPVEYPPEFSSDLVDLLENMFKKDPQERYNFEEVKRHVWYGDNDGDSEGESLRRVPRTGRKKKKTRSIDGEGKTRRKPRSNPSSDTEGGPISRTRSSKSLGEEAAREDDITTPNTPRTPITPRTGGGRSAKDEDNISDSNAAGRGDEAGFVPKLRKLLPWPKKNEKSSKSPGRLSRRTSREYPEQAAPNSLRRGDSTLRQEKREAVSNASSVSERSKKFNNLVDQFNNEELLQAQSPPTTPEVTQAMGKPIAKREKADGGGSAAPSPVQSGITKTVQTIQPTQSGRPGAITSAPASAPVPVTSKGAGTRSAAAGDHGFSTAYAAVSATSPGVSQAFRAPTGTTAATGTVAMAGPTIVQGVHIGSMAGAAAGQRQVRSRDSSQTQSKVVSRETSARDSSVTSRNRSGPKTPDEWEAADVKAKPASQPGQVPFSEQIKRQKGQLSRLSLDNIPSQAALKVPEATKVPSKNETMLTATDEPKSGRLSKQSSMRKQASNSDARRMGSSNQSQADRAALQAPKVVRQSTINTSASSDLQKRSSADSNLRATLGIDKAELQDDGPRTLPAVPGKLQDTPPGSLAAGDLIDDDLSLRLDKSSGLLEGIDRLDRSQRASVGATSGAGAAVTGNGVLDRRAKPRDGKSRSPSVGSRGSSVILPKQDRWGSYAHRKPEGGKSRDNGKTEGKDDASSLASSGTDGNAEDVTVELERSEKKLTIDEQPEPLDRASTSGPLRTPWYDDSEYVGAIDNVFLGDFIPHVDVDASGRVYAGTEYFSFRDQRQRISANAGHGRPVQKLWPRLQ